LELNNRKEIREALLYPVPVMEGGCIKTSLVHVTNLLQSFFKCYHLHYKQKKWRRR